MSKIRMLSANYEVSAETCFKEFIDHCKVKNLSEATIKNYNQHWWYFTYWWNNTSVHAINQDTITAYIRYLQGKHSNVDSINTALRHMRAIFNYFSSQNYIPPILIKLLKTEQKVKDCYTEAELQILLKKPDIKRCRFPEFRTWAIINFFLGTGCRVRSLTNIKVGDVDLENNIVKLATTKNRKQQVLPLPNSLTQVLRQYMKHRQGSLDDYLFPTETNAKLSESSVQHDVAKYNRDRGVDRIGLHLFRHTFAKNFVLSGGDVFRLQKMLGHSSLEMSRRYANIYDTDLQNGLDAFNLLEKLSNGSQRIKLR